MPTQRPPRTLTTARNVPYDIGGIAGCIVCYMPTSAAVQVSDLKPEVVSQIRHLMDPHEQLFGSTVQSSSRVDAKKKPVRQLQHAPGFPALSPIALVLDNKQSQLWHAPDMPHVMHCARYCFFPRPSMVCTPDYAADADSSSNM